MPIDRTVVSLATIPSRIDKLAPVLDSIKEQTRKPDQIYVCICKFCEWEQRRYDVPQWLLDDPDVRVCVAEQDRGPANKLLGVLREESSPDTRIVIVDDDWRCNPDLLERLDARFQPHARTALGISGARLPRYWSSIDVRIGREIATAPPLPWRLTFLAEPADDVPVDILQFGFGAMVLREWFDDDIQALAEPGQALFYSDDVLFSAYLEHKGVKRLCICGVPLPVPLEQAAAAPLSGEGRMTRNYRAAVPAVSSVLGVWPRKSLAPAFRRARSFAELRYWCLLALRKCRRVAARGVPRINWGDRR